MTLPELSVISSRAMALVNSFTRPVFMAGKTCTWLDE